MQYLVKRISRPPKNIGIHSDRIWALFNNNVSLFTDGCLVLQTGNTASRPAPHTVSQAQYRPILFIDSWPARLDSTKSSFVSPFTSRLPQTSFNAPVSLRSCRDQCAVVICGVCRDPHVSKCDCRSVAYSQYLSLTKCAIIKE